MRETPKAAQAWNDYLAMGQERSLAKLLARYREQAGHEGGMRPPTVKWATLSLWSRAHNWQQRLAEIAEAERQAIIARGIAERQNRIDAQNERWRKMLQVIEERSRDPKLAEVPGGQTGLIVASPVLVKVYRAKRKTEGEELSSTRKTVVLHEYAVDAALLKELRELEKHTAQELGQWTEKADLTVERLVREYVGIDPDEV